MEIPQCGSNGMNKFCTECGKPVTTKFCGECGAPACTAKKEPKKKHCFVLNNYEFPEAAHILGYQSQEDANLLGYQKDSTRIRQTFEALEFAVDEKMNRDNRDEMLAVFRDEWLNKTDFTEAECVVVFILSHGGQHGVLYACDASKVHIDEIRNMFSNHKQLKGVPLLFFVQACRGSATPDAVKTENEYKKSALRLSTESKFRNSFVFYCTPEGFAGFVGDSGSIFVTKLCDVMDKHGKTDNLWNLVTRITKAVSETTFQYDNSIVAQCPEAVFSLSSDVKLWTTDVEDGSGTPMEVLKLSERNPCFIISNTKCDTHKLACRYFNEYKEDAIKTFSKLNFNILEKNDLKLKELETMFKDLKKGKVKSIEGSECLVFVVLSCGGIISDDSPDPVIYGSDSLHYSIDDMMRKATSIEGLKEKPKVFFMILNKCSKEKFRKSGEEDKIKQTWRAHGTNTFIYYIILDNGTHTIFMEELCKVLEEFSKKGCHLGEVVYEVNKRMFEIYDEKNAVKHTPEVCSTLTKLLHFSYVGACQQNVIEEVQVESKVEEVVEDKPRDEELAGEAIRAASTTVSDDGHVLQYQNSEEDDDNDVMFDQFSKGTDAIDGGSSSETSPNQDNTDQSEDPFALGNIQYGLPRGSLDYTTRFTQGSTSPPDPLPNTLTVESHTTAAVETGGMSHSTDLSTSTTAAPSSGARQAQAQMFENAPATTTTTTTAENTTETQATENTATEATCVHLVDLSYKQRKEIFTMLSTGLSTWRDFGHVLVEDFSADIKISKEEIDNLPSADDASPAAVFLERLSVKQPEFTIRNFSDIAKGNNRNDIVQRIASWSEKPGKKLTEIDSDKKMALTRLLDKKKVANTWRDFAGELRFKTKEINEIRKEAEENRKAPSELLLDLIDEKYDKFKLTDFLSILQKITRRDIAGVLKNIMSSSKESLPSEDSVDGSLR